MKTSLGDLDWDTSLTQITQLNDEDKIPKGYVLITGDTQGKTGSKALIAPQPGAKTSRPAEEGSTSWPASQASGLRADLTFQLILMCLLPHCPGGYLTVFLLLIFI